MPLGKPEPWVLPVTLVCLALGALVASMLRSATSDNPDGATPLQQIIYLQRRVDKLTEEVKEWQDKYNTVLMKSGSDTAATEALKKELSDVQVQAGMTPVAGPGIVITIDDSVSSLKPNITGENASPLLTHDLDLLMLVNELRSAGAEAIELNGQRVVGSTAIRCVGPVIQVNEQRISAPFVVKAIGKTDVLYGAVNLPYGVLDGLKPLGIKVDVSKRDNIRVTAILTPPKIEVGKPVLDESNKSGGQH